MLLHAAVTAQTDGAFRTNVAFSVVHAAGSSSNVFVAGSSASLGEWDLTRAPRLRPGAANTWQAEVALPAGTNVSYRYFRRSDASGSFGSTNVTWLGPATNLAMPPTPPAPYEGKSIAYHSSWSNVFLLWRQGTNAWATTNLLAVGPGRFPGEFLHVVTGVGRAGWPIEFVLNNGAGQWDNAFGQPGSNYLTPLDHLFLQDGHVFNYRPPAALSAPRLLTTNVASTQPGIDGRTIRILLPRGYDQNTNRRYPVFYLHDGQNVFDPGGPFGSWSVNVSAPREIQMGRVREVILVGMDNTAARMTEYCPPQDRSGIGDRYRNFVVHNVRPMVDAAFRTLNDPANTGVAGSSLGGLVSHYFGTSTNVFGKVGPMSPSYWYAPNWVAANAASTPRTGRFSLDWGTAESDSSMWFPAWNMVNTLNAAGYVFGADLFYNIGVGDGHNEAAWARRFPLTLRFLFDIREEPNALAFAAVPPQLIHPSLSALEGQRAISFTAPMLGGIRYELQRTGSPAAPAWTNLSTFRTGEPWGTTNLTDLMPAATPAAFYRLRAVPAP